MAHKATWDAKFIIIVLTVLLAGGFFASGCSSDKGEKTEDTEQVGETEEVEVEVETPEEPAGTQPEAEKDEGETREGLPPEISGPCKGKQEGDPCVVVITGGAEIKGTCALTSTKKLACKPGIIENKDKVLEPESMPAEPESPGTE
jgi:hypothetical protein